MTDATPIQAAVGGVLIALSLAIMLVATGRIAGLSNVFAGLIDPTPEEWGWRAWFVLGALAVAAVFQLVDPSTFDRSARMPLPVVAVAGVLVGAGTRLSNGCTSGHGLCGMSRGAKRSIVATGVFFAIAVATATISGEAIR